MPKLCNGGCFATLNLLVRSCEMFTYSAGLHETEKKRKQFLKSAQTDKHF